MKNTKHYNFGVFFIKYSVWKSPKKNCLRSLCNGRVQIRITCYFLDRSLETKHKLRIQPHSLVSVPTPNFNQVFINRFVKKNGRFQFTCLAIFSLVRSRNMFWSRPLRIAQFSSPIPFLVLPKLEWNQSGNLPRLNPRLLQPSKYVLRRLAVEFHSN